MREILFRGKRLDVGEWEEGSLVKTVDSLLGAERFSIIRQRVTDAGILTPSHTWYAVDPKTVGQYTGMTDKNGKRIFEGDIVKTHYANTPKPDFVEQVVFLNGRFCCMYEFGKSKMWSRLPDKDFKPMSDYSVYMEWCEVIGNVHDHPELLAEVKG